MSSSRYFKLVALPHKGEEWYIREFFQGRARYGWSPPGADLTLRLHGGKPWEEWPKDVRGTWGYTQFLVERIEVGHRVVVQTNQPIRSFLVGEVIEPGYEFDGSLEDFNHILRVRPLVSEPIPVNSKAVSATLKHDLSKRGHYYEIYPERSIQELDELVARSQADQPLGLGATRSEQDTRDRAFEAAKAAICEVIRNTWPAARFEALVEELCQHLPYVEVKERVDRRKGWDLLVRFINPITGEVLLDEVPVQCKNYSGEVHVERPIDDLVRCIENSDSTRAMLFILGTLPDSFYQRVTERAAELTQRLGRGEIVFDVVDESRIAEIYAATLGSSPSGASQTP